MFLSTLLWNILLLSTVSKACVQISNMEVTASGYDNTWGNEEIYAEIDVDSILFQAICGDPEDYRDIAPYDTWYFFGAFPCYNGMKIKLYEYGLFGDDYAML